MSVVKGMDNLLKKLSKAQQITLDSSKKEITRKTLSIQKDAKLNAPDSPSGSLRNSIKTEVKVEDNKVSGKVYTKSPYAMYVEFGTGPKGKGTADLVPKGVSLQYRETPWFVNINDFPDYDKYNFIQYTVGDETFVLVRGQKAQQFMSPAAFKYNGKIGKDVGAYISSQLRKELKK